VDARFSAVRYDPTFLKMKQKERKVVVDKRFKNAAKSKEGKQHFVVEQKEEDLVNNAPTGQQLPTINDSEDESVFEGDLNDLIGEVQEEYDFLAEEEGVVREEISTKRLALMNYDWAKITPGDIFVTFSSFLPVGGELKSVKLYKSDLGEEMLQKEAMYGPLSIWGEQDPTQPIEAEEGQEEYEEEEEENVNVNAVRRYEIERLKYYYSVLEFDSAKTADFIYNNCNDFELENTGNKIDLRAIPDDLKIPKAPEEVCKEKPFKVSDLNFNTKAKTNTNVEITWEKEEKGNKHSALFEHELEDDAKIDMSKIIASDDLASSQSEEDSDELDHEEARAELLGNKNRETLFSDFDKSKRGRGIDVKFKAAFATESEDEEDEVDKNKIVFSRKFKNDVPPSENEEEENPQEMTYKDDFFEGGELPVEIKEGEKTKTKKEKFRQKLKEKKKKLRSDQEKAQDNHRTQRHQNNQQANLELLTKRQDSEIPDEFAIDMDDDRFGRFFKDNDMSIDPTNPLYDREKSKPLFDKKKKTHKKIKR